VYYNGSMIVPTNAQVPLFIERVSYVVSTASFLLIALDF
jgi:hypothetical protein